jgi:hypothetical protein
MHGGKNHRHGHDHGHEHSHDLAGEGHNHAARPQKVTQWQTPHLPGGGESGAAHAGEPDLDLVERAFIEGFAGASDPTSFLRLAHVPFEGVDGEGKRLVLLRVETDAVTDVGSVTPHVGGASFRYDVLPARMTNRRGRLRLVYFDGEGLRPLTLEQAKSLKP